MHKTPPQDYAGNITVDTRLGGIKRYFLGSRKDIKMRLPDEICQCVVFLCVRSIDENGEHFSFIGTAMAVSVPSKAIPMKSYHYLVTARHVIEGGEGKKLWIRLNNIQGNAIHVDATDAYWWDYPTENENELPVDAAMYKPPWKTLRL